MTYLAENVHTAQAETRQLLAGLRRDLAALIAASADTNADDEHDPEGATIAFERAQLAASIEQAEGRLRDLELAERRLVAGEYEACESCGGPIGEQRLLARPATRRCVRCA
ncbi:MAG TPA: TraR/DksA C4-type zinc finger protein [Jatrophihabitans sp.]|nr:TraR/DksA C4-type zinc finger protein [Jatrophihabitans sp.]